MTTHVPIQNQCTYYLIKCSKSLLDYGPDRSRLLFKYESCLYCSKTIAIILLNITYNTQRKISGHLNPHSLDQLQLRIDYYLSLILDKYMFVTRAN